MQQALRDVDDEQLHVGADFLGDARRLPVHND
jgi:hypothetical protein